MIEQIKKIAEQVEENESKKLLLESEITHLEEVLKYGVTSRFAEENAIYIYSPKTGHEIRRKLEDDYKLMHSKLSIPKKIADGIVKLAKYHQTAAAVNGDVFGILEATEWIVNFMSAGRENVMNPELFDYLNQDKSGHIETCIAFMNPLTRPFVEVIDE